MFRLQRISATRSATAPAIALRQCLAPARMPIMELHIHLDLIERKQGYRMCQWQVGQPPETEVAAQVPLPPPNSAVPIAR